MSFIEGNVEAPRVKLSLAYQKIAVTNRYDDPWQGFNRRMYDFMQKQTNTYFTCCCWL
ncbi:MULTISPECIES: hypothetical protein [unclassified Colwellia]|uniref:hypothetical protein n=1 Tax=unclassified Colwellia TaxID=196834 RepID=UPI0015F57CA9|nr:MULTISPECIES: hypothetical protein [unclassified Colwellia]MBA6348250.1 hypothetical protein [Colwellia sp. BRX8-9]MBA6351434.1 hypothetical protein [Colwellia sp. BRX9-1]MBA6380715.1 hypothetical protein [Colwellia sp. BRX10-7]MBA6381983.1 hypothetical protein [Colwellia sp. BRX10-9]MBA6385793.1 hypothetical protein [Colwellia sp. BRX10-2]